MPKRRIPVRYAVGALALCLALAGCKARAQLPVDAMGALQNTWSELDLPRDEWPETVRAWQGDMSRVTDDPTVSTTELWCVETAQNTGTDVSIGGETLIWIVVRSSKQDEWQAALLMTMSSLWAYQACGVLR
jgi:hypothetical protein